MHMWFLAASFVVVPVCLLINAWIDRRDAARKPLPFTTTRNRNVVDLAAHKASLEQSRCNDTPKVAVFAGRRG